MDDEKGANCDTPNPSRPRFMSAAAICALVRMVEMHGVSLEAVGLPGDLETQTDPDRPYPYRVGLELWRELNHRAPDAHLALEFADLALATDRDLVRHLLHQSRTFGLALERFIEFQRLVDSEAPVELREGGEPEETELRFRPSPILLSSQQPFESMVASVFNLCRGLIGPVFRPTEVAFGHARERALGGYSEFFGREPRFDAGRTALCFPRNFSTDRSRARCRGWIVTSRPKLR